MPKIHIITEWQKAHDAVADFLGVMQVPQQTGLHIVDFLHILDRAGVKYGIQSGRNELAEMSKVHRGIKKNSTMYQSQSSTNKSPPIPDKHEPAIRPQGAEPGYR